MRQFIFLGTTQGEGFVESLVFSLFSTIFVSKKQLTTNVLLSILK